MNNGWYVYEFAIVCRYLAGAFFVVPHREPPVNAMCVPAMFTISRMCCRDDLTAGRLPGANAFGYELSLPHVLQRTYISEGAGGYGTV